ncbi:unnamed protein product [Linum trigynum]|uniref:Uncharacterized protein n=1 Tax=Linum trigynum TaxID=586398 RepID=A0AAV2DC58_9ROSI
MSKANAEEAAGMLLSERGKGSISVLIMSEEESESLPSLSGKSRFGTRASIIVDCADDSDDDRSFFAAAARHGVQLGWRRMSRLISGAETEDAESRFLGRSSEVEYGNSKLSFVLYLSISLFSVAAARRRLIDGSSSIQKEARLRRRFECRLRLVLFRCRFECRISLSCSSSIHLDGEIEDAIGSYGEDDGSGITIWVWDSNERWGIQFEDRVWNPIWVRDSIQSCVH